MSCEDQTKQPRQTGQASGSTGLPAPACAARGYIRQLVEMAEAGLPVAYEQVVAIPGFEQAITLEDMLKLDNPANQHGWTVAHEASRRGRLFRYHEARKLGDPQDRFGRTIEDVHFAQHLSLAPHLNKQEMLAFFKAANPDESGDVYRPALAAAERMAFYWEGMGDMDRSLLEMTRDVDRVVAEYLQPWSEKVLRAAAGWNGMTDAEMLAIFREEVEDGETLWCDPAEAAAKHLAYIWSSMDSDFLNAQMLQEDVRQIGQHLHRWLGQLHASRQEIAGWEAARFKRYASHIPLEAFISSLENAETSGYREPGDFATVRYPGLTFEPGGGVSFTGGYNPQPIYPPERAEKIDGSEEYRYYFQDVRQGLAHAHQTWVREMLVRRERPPFAVLSSHPELCRQFGIRLDQEKQVVYRDSARWD